MSIITSAEKQSLFLNCLSEISSGADNRIHFGTVYNSLRSKIENAEDKLLSVLHCIFNFKNIPAEYQTVEMFNSVINFYKSIQVSDKYAHDLVRSLASSFYQSAQNNKYDLTLELVKIYGEYIQNIDDEFKTHEVYLAAVKQNGYALRLVKNEYKTEELCLAAVKKSGHALWFVPDEMKTEEICIAAVNQSSAAIVYVKNLTPAVIIAAFMCDNPSDDIEKLKKFIKQNTF